MNDRLKRSFGRLTGKSPTTSLLEVDAIRAALLAEISSLDFVFTKPIYLLEE